MMVLDTSCIIAVIFAEPDAEYFSEKLARAEGWLLSAATVVEATVVLARRTKSQDDRDLANFLDAVPAQIVPLDEQQSRIARNAYSRFGQVSGHRACLNFGDCFSYALAKSRNLPLLFKGHDFIHTDVVQA